MGEATQAVLRVALLAEKYQRDKFRALLESEGMEIVLDDTFNLPLPDGLNGAEVLLVDMTYRSDRTRCRMSWISRRYQCYLIRAVLAAVQAGSAGW